MANNTFLPADAQLPAINVDAVLTMTAPTDGRQWVLYGFSWSYSAAPTGGKILITYTIGATTYVETYLVSAGGPGQIIFARARHFPPNIGITITAKAGGSAIYCTVYGEAEALM